MVPDNTEYFFAQATFSQERVITKMMPICVMTKI